MATDEELAFDVLRLAMMALRPLIRKGRPWTTDRQHLTSALRHIREAEDWITRAMRRLDAGEQPRPGVVPDMSSTQNEKGE